MIKLPSYWDSVNKLENTPDAITPIERFILEQEPAGEKGEAWRLQLIAALEFNNKNHRYEN